MLAMYLHVCIRSYRYRYVYKTTHINIWDEYVARLGSNILGTKVPPCASLACCFFQLIHAGMPAKAHPVPSTGVTAYAKGLNLWTKAYL